MFDNWAHYTRVGRQAAALVSDAKPARVRTVLDLACGYGRVIRHLVAHWPHAEFTAADVVSEAADFCASAFGAQPLHCVVPLSNTACDTSFDVVWSGSFLTHVASGSWDDALGWVRTHLSPSGRFIFTTHGRSSADAIRSQPPGPSADEAPPYGLTTADNISVLATFDSAGFGYADYPWGRGKGYGISVSTPGWVDGALDRAGLRLVRFVHRGWDDHQDVYVCEPQPEGDRTL